MNIDTGEPMGDLAVVATAWFVASPAPLGQSENANVYRLVTRTRADGSYRLPSSWGRIWIGTPGTDPLTTWSVVALKPGYVIPGDERSWSFDDWGNPLYYPKSLRAGTVRRWGLLAADLQPIMLRQQKLSLQESAAYYGILNGHAKLPNSADSEADEKMRTEFRSFFVEQICNDDNGPGVGFWTARGIMEFAVDLQGAFLEMLASEPVIFKQEVYGRLFFQHPACVEQ